jgi:hypothetical protein
MSHTGSPAPNMDQIERSNSTDHVSPKEFPHQDGDQVFVETFFEEGSLGVTLKRRTDDGVVYISEIVANSQAINMDVQPGDELWIAADQDIGGEFIDQEAWRGLVNFIKVSHRPLRLVWRRLKNQNFVPVPPHVTPPPPAPQEQQVPAERRLSQQQQQPSPQQLFPQQDADYLALKNALVRLVVSKESSGGVLGLGGGSTQSTKKALPDPMTFLKEGRRLVKQGDLNIETKTNSIWSKSPNKRRLTLMNDTLIISIPQSGNVAAIEFVIDLQICKVKCFSHIFTLHNVPVEQQQALEGTNNTSSSNDNGPAEEDLSFDLLWPGGDMHLLAETRVLKDEWVMNIYNSICECVGGTVQYLGWRHQYLIGTMHSAVLSRNEARVLELISLCEAGKLDFKAIESFDDDGYTPLHYACMLRLQNIVKLLHEATADVTAADNDGFTPLHWAAMQLDDFSLNLLCSHVFDLDLLDKKQRSPLVLACIEGRDISGVTDEKVLRKCLEVMVSHKPNLLWRDSHNRNLLHYLAASWQSDPMEVLLENGCGDVNSIEDEFGMTALHFTARASPIKGVIGEGFKILNRGGYNNEDLLNDQRPEPINSPCCIDTLRMLLQYGCKPNFKDTYGRNALQILLVPENEILWERDDLEAAIALLVSYGTRIDDALIGAIRLKFPDLNIPALQEKWNGMPPVDCQKLGIK